MTLKMKLDKVVEGLVGLYLILPGIEDLATGETTLVPSAMVGAALLADAFNVKL